MQPLNAIDAITPAFTRTHQILFKPFRAGRSWKLAATQYLGLMGAFFAPFFLFAAFLPASVLNGTSRGVVFAITFVITLFFFVFFYIGARLQFVNFEMIVTGEQFIAPMWRRYGRRVWPIIGLKALLGTVSMLLCVPIVLRMKDSFLIAMKAMPQPGSSQPPDPQAMQDFFGVIIGFYVAMFAFFLFFKIFSTILEDMVMPFYILEDISIGEALHRGLHLFLADPIQWILYLVMKFVLGTVGFVMQYISNIIVYIPVFILVLIFALIGGGIGTLVHGNMHAGGILLMVVCGLLYFAAIAAVCWYGIGSLGYLFMLLEAYSIYFLGGRYPHLGDLLEPPVAPYVFTPPPTFPSREETKDGDDDGPSLPMNPAMA